LVLRSFPGRCGTEHQAIDALPQPTESAAASHHLETEKKERAAPTQLAHGPSQSQSFSTATFYFS
jgi:hypothetical protein